MRRVTCSLKLKSKLGMVEPVPLKVKSLSRLNTREASHDRHEFVFTGHAESADGVACLVPAVDESFNLASKFLDW